MSTPTRKLKRAATVAASKVLVTDGSSLATTSSNLSAAELDRLQFQGANIASASSIDLGAATGDFILVTGTTAITALGTVAAGTKREVRFAAALTLTHNGTSLILPTAANITTAADDCATFVSLGSGNWICTKYAKKSGSPLASSLQLYAENPSSPTAHTISGGNSAAIGSGCQVTGGVSFAGGNLSTNAHGYSFCWGDQIDLTGTAGRSAAFGGGHEISTSNSFATGQDCTVDTWGQRAHSAGNNSVQDGTYQASGATTNATQTEIYPDSSVPSRITLRNNSTRTFKILVVARRTDATGENDGWEFTGLIHRDANAASTTLDALQVNQLGATAWSVAVDADTTNGSLRIRVTGEAAKNIAWGARIDTIERG